MLLYSAVLRVKTSACIFGRNSLAHKKQDRMYLLKIIPMLTNSCLWRSFEEFWEVEFCYNWICVCIWEHWNTVNTVWLVVTKRFWITLPSMGLLCASVFITMPGSMLANTPVVMWVCICGRTGGLRLCCLNPIVLCGFFLTCGRSSDTLHFPSDVM